MNDMNVERRTPQTQTPEQQLQAMLDAFDKANAKGEVHPGQDLKAVLDSTPGLKANVLDAIEKHQLQKIEALNVAGALGVYMGDSRTIQISPDQLHIARIDPEMLNSVRFTLGHEVKHAADRAQIMSSDASLEQGINAIAQGNGKVHDYTAVIKQFNETSRSLETHAELTGYNVVVDQVLKDNPKATLRDVYNTSPDDMDPYIEKGGTPGNPTFTPRPGITLEGLKMPETKENLAGVNTYFYEARGYPGQNVSQLLDYAGQVEAQLHPGKDAPQIQVNLGALGVAKGELSTSTPFIGAGTTHKRAAPATDGATPTLTDGLSGNRLYDGAANGLGRTRTGAALEGSAFQQAAAAMAVQAQKDGLSRIDSVHEGQDGRLFSIQGQPGAPDALRSHVDREQVLRQPLEQSVQTLQAPTPQPQVQPREQDVQQHAPLMR